MGGVVGIKRGAPKKGSPVRLLPSRRGSPKFWGPNWGPTCPFSVANFGVKRCGINGACENSLPNAKNLDQSRFGHSAWPRISYNGAENRCRLLSSGPSTANAAKQGTVSASRTGRAKQASIEFGSRLLPDFPKPKQRCGPTLAAI
jgi:hypothetical protein